MYHRRSFLWLVLLIVLSSAMLPASPAAASSVVDDTSSSLGYSTGWIAYGPSPSWTRAVSSTLHSTASSSTIASVSLTFTGSIVTYMYTMASNRGTANVYIDSTLMSTVNAYAPETRWRSSRTFKVGYGTHILTIASNGNGYIDIDAIGIDGNFATGNSVYDDTTVDTFSFWTLDYYGSAYNGTSTYSQTAGDGVNFAFYGAGVSLIFARANNRGYAKITIDDNDVGAIDQYGTSIQWQQRISFGGLELGYHIINVTVAGAKRAASSGYYVDVDGFQILGGCPNFACCAWAVQLRVDHGHYTSVKTNLSNGVPAIRDGGFSAEVIWMGDYPNHKNYIEIGWRRNIRLTENGTQENQTRLYWGYWDKDGQWHGPNEERSWLGDYTTTHSLAIKKVFSDATGSTLAVYADGVDKGRIYFPGLTTFNTIVAFGGEVTHYGTGIRNAMGVGEFSSLQFNEGSGYINWPQDSGNRAVRNYNYQLFYVTDGRWQTYGYN